ncbi:hypothetical protein [Plantactinospora endophytica]|uniref:Uncharacterized protein n=1 Tax=Plantactinospora endophytica TaxID=673535 RepID=A0ABQ4E2R7_9ACTN|nr:hypothetical protein [Plantactinospora endophytica]GIG88988.1 hypothetical protein Pen02_39240 [Plantactinospora endophytica]
MPDDVSIPRQDGSVPRREGPDGRRDAGGEDPAPSGGATDTTPDGAGVVSWGDPPRTGGRAGLMLHRLGRDGRLVPVVGVAGAGAVFASLVGDWAVTSMTVEGAESSVTLGSGVADMSGFGTAYLVGVFGVVGCLALVFFGSPRVRHDARVAGLAVAGAVLGVLFATAGSLDTLADRWQMYGQLDGMTIEYGQGLVMAYVGTGGLGLALLLAGRFVRRSAAEPAPAAEPGTPAPTGQVPPQEESDWPWRRPRAASAPEVPDDDDGRPPPIDLTVTPTKPFAH